MSTLDYIKNEVKKLFATSPNIHLSIRSMQAKTSVEKVPVKLVGAYRNIFQVEELGVAARPERHSFQYGDILIGRIIIQELDYTPPEPQPPRQIKG